MIAITILFIFILFKQNSFYLAIINALDFNFMANYQMNTFHYIYLQVLFITFKVYALTFVHTFTFFFQSKLFIKKSSFLILSLH